LLSTNRLIFISLLVFAALLLFVAGDEDATGSKTRTQNFVRAREAGFVVGNRPFRFVGANVAVVYGESERAAMPATLADVSAAGVRVVRVWAHGEWDANSQGRAPNDWLRAGAFRNGRDEWNEAAFAHLDRTLAEAAQKNLRVQICLANWWRDTGGVVQYLAWAGDTRAADAKLPFGINYAEAMRFYTDEEARRLYREHVRRVVTRRNTVTGILYADDPTIFAYELINEAQSLPGRDAERRLWVDEMSRYVKSLDANHLVTPGVWGYRTARERREWIADHKLPAVDFCDVHLYPRDDADSFAATPDLMRDFIENRMAAALAVRKPLVFGEWGMVREGFGGVTQPDWFKNYFASAAQAGVAGASFWIVTPDPEREYGVVFDPARDADVRAEIKRGANLFAGMEGVRAAAKVVRGEFVSRAAHGKHRASGRDALATGNFARHRRNTPLPLPSRINHTRTL
jgi:mannan endo-1,4-beta-mannosidase